MANGDIKEDRSYPFMSTTEKWRQAFEGGGGEKQFCFGCTYLHFNIQNTASPLFPNILDRLHARPVEIAPELRVLDERFLPYQLLEFLPCHVPVFPPMLLAGAGSARRMGDGECEAVGMLFEESCDECGFPGA